MSNIFEEALEDAKGLEEKMLGPTYPYYDNVRTPAQIGMSDKGSLSALGNDIDGLIQYVELLVTGNSKASSTGGPLGNKFFLQTGATCNDPSGVEQDRYIYINNVPEGNIPFISQGMGVDFTEFKGLIPGAMGNLNVLNPYSIMTSFLSGSTPDCQELTMQTIDINNNKSSETHFVTVVDIQNMDACSFSNNTNPITNATCSETFQVIYKDKDKDSEKNKNYHYHYNNGKNGNNGNNGPILLPKDPIVQLYFFCLSMIGIYFLYKLMEKGK